MKEVGGLIWRRGMGKYGWSRWRMLVSSGATGAVNVTKIKVVILGTLFFAHT